MDQTGSASSFFFCIHIWGWIDGGATFGDKINLSNATEADSWRVEIAGEGGDVVVSWSETNQTSDVPVARISTDGGQIFGPMLMLGMNGTITDTEDEAGGALAGIEELQLMRK